MARAISGVQYDARHGPVVHAAQINGERTVDEHPNIVIPGKLEILSALIFEPVSKFAGETKVVIQLLVAVTYTIVGSASSAGEG